MHCTEKNMIDEGTITTVRQRRVTVIEGAQYTYDQAVAQELACDATAVAPGLSVVGGAPAQQAPAAETPKGFWARIGAAIKRFFTYNIPGKNPRAWELDIMRGIIMLAVTLDHCCTYGLDEALITPHTYLAFWLREFAIIYKASSMRHALQPFGLFLICFMSGMNSSFTRSSGRRVIKFWIFCALFTGGYALLHVIWPELVSAYFVFNIIAVLTICFTAWWLLDKIKCPSWLRGYIGALLIVVGLTYFYLDYIGDGAYVNNPVLALMVYNEHAYQMSPQNFEPLLPHLGFFLVGGVVGRYLYPDRKTHAKTVYPPKGLTPLLLIGKHSLAAYITLPFILLGIVKLISVIVGLF